MIKIRLMMPADVPDAKTMMLTVAAGIFEPDQPAAKFINRYGTALSDVDDYQNQYGPPGGTFLVATDDDRIIGSGAIRRIDDETGELRRMWLLEAYHGQGIGYQIAQHLFTFARAAGYRRVRLSTSAVQKRAIRFYERLGFYPIDRYRDTDDEIFLEFMLPTLDL
jgi:putative acetyltransferase